MSEDGWFMVGSHNKIVKPKTLISDSTPLSKEELVTNKKAPSIGQINRSLEKKKIVLNDSKFLISTKDQILVELNKLPEIHYSQIKLICYGIGSIFKSSISQFQFILLQFIKEWIEEFSKTTITIELFDPILSEKEKQFFCDKGCICYDTDEKCCKIVNPDQFTLFYMPHCEKFMYCNVLTTNGDRLDKIMIIGNSFEHYNLICFSKKTRKEIRPILSVLGKTIEIPFIIFTEATDVFNNTCLIKFQ